MSSDFNPNDKKTQIKGNDYLEAKYRIQWFRSENPTWAIITDIVSIEPAIVKANIINPDGITISTGHGMAIPKGNENWSTRYIEKAETAAIARALAHAGYGTQFLESDDDHLADSPVSTPTPAPATNGNGAGQASKPSAFSKPRPWADKDAINSLMERCADGLGLSESDVLTIVNIDQPTNYKAWNANFPHLRAAADFIKEKAGTVSIDGEIEAIAQQKAMLPDEPPVPKHLSEVDF